MPQIPFQLFSVVQSLDSGHSLGELLLFPNVQVLVRRLDRLQSKIEARALEELDLLPAGELHRQRVPETPAQGRIEVEVRPPSSQILWREPVLLHFDYVHWQHGDEARVIAVPALAITVVARSGERFEERLLQQIRFALTRLRANTSLRSLVSINRAPELELRELELEPSFRTLKQNARAERDAAEDEDSVLEKVAARIGSKKSPTAYELDEPLAQLSDALLNAERTSVLLVGPSGVGKTVLVHEFARRWGRLSPVWSTSGSRLVAGMSGFGMWQERCQKLARESQKKKILLHLGNLVELIEVGKGGGSQHGIAAFLRPYLKRGQLVAIAECTREELSAIEQQEPQLLDVFQQLEVTEPSPGRARSILLSAALDKPSGDHSAIDLEAIETVDRLHRHYASYSAYPGRPLRFLNNLLADRQPGRTLRSADVTAAFSSETGLPSFMLDESQPLERDATHDWFASRVMGQPQPVQLVTDMLLTVKAGLTRSGRPIASFLFAGPTGVGKTEMAKALSEFMYGDPTRMVRFDMSEYADPLAIDRLIGGTFSTAGLLTQRVREQPFTVVLLDEFEKAHPNFFDLLLQVLGEGRLTDSAGRVADFTNSIIIMTSNLGADSYQATQPGFSAGTSQPMSADDHFVRKIQEFVRPEFFNRIDRIVPFAPLDRATIRAITLRELELVRQRDGIQYRRIALDIDEAVVEHLAACGYEPQYGARPLKRSVARRLLSPLADAMNQYAATLPLEASVSMAGEAVDVHVRASTQTTEQPQVDQRLDAARRVTLVRRDMQMLRASATMRALENQQYRLQMQHQRLQKRRKWHRTIGELNQLLHPLQQIVQRAEHLESELEVLEDETHLAVFQQEQPSQDVVERLDLATTELRDLMLELYLRDTAQPNLVNLALFSESMERAVFLAFAYVDYISHLDGSCELLALRLHRPERTGARFHLLEQVPPGEAPRVVLDVFDVRNPSDFRQSPPNDLLGVGLRIKAACAAPRLLSEAGRHVFVDEHGEQSCLVETFGKRFVEYSPPMGIERRGNLPQAELCRRYDFAKEQAFDPVLDRTFRMIGSIDAVLQEAIEARFERGLRSVLGSWK